MANELYSNEAGFQHEMNDCNKKALKHTVVIAISTALLPGVIELHANCHC